MANTKSDDEARVPDTRAPYEAPRLQKKRSIERVTLFSGSGASSVSSVSGLTGH